jgi:hypothetical protein
VVYIYKVRAVLGEHVSEFSNTDSGYASGGGGDVNPPFELWATDGEHSDKVVVSWSHEGEYSYFEIWRKLDGEGHEWARIGTSEALHFIDWEVDPGVVYIYKARAILGEQESEFSNTDGGYASEGWIPAPGVWGPTASMLTKSSSWGYELEGRFRRLSQAARSGRRLGSHRRDPGPQLQRLRSRRRRGLRLQGRGLGGRQPQRTQQRGQRLRIRRLRSRASWGLVAARRPVPTRRARIRGQYNYLTQARRR